MSFNENGIQNGKNQNWKIQNQITIQQQQQHNIQSHTAVISDGGLRHFPLENKSGISRRPGGGDVTSAGQSGVTTFRTDFSGLFTGKRI